MLNRLLPVQANNAYHGYRIALWVFGFIVAFKALIALNGGLFDAYDVSLKADGIPLNTWPHIAVQDFLSQSAAFGFSEFMFCIVCAIVLARYRSLVPLMFTLLLIEQVVRRLIYQVIPMIRVGAPGGMINIFLTSVMVLGLVLALIPRQPSPRTAAL